MTGPSSSSYPDVPLSISSDSDIEDAVSSSGDGAPRRHHPEDVLVHHHRHHHQRHDNTDEDDDDDVEHFNYMRDDDDDDGPNDNGDVLEDAGKISLRAHNEVAAMDQPQPQQPPDYTLDDDDDDGSGREYRGVFEGPEKTLEVMFRRIETAPNKNHHDHHHDNAFHRHIGGNADDDIHDNGGGGGGGDSGAGGLRCLKRSDLDRICARARCTILSSVHNAYLDAYVLSESSLFVYPYMLVLKTCGTTTLLRCIAILIDLGRRVLGLEIDWVGYSRKNFNFPGDQAFPHQSFQQELDYLYGHRNLCERLNGNGYTLGPVTSDHWFVFVADQTIRSKGGGSADCLDTDRVLNIMMFDIDEAVANIFYYDQYVGKGDAPNNGGGKATKKTKKELKEDEIRRISKAQTAVSGIDALCPGAIIDPRAFEPCGYSMNAILFRSYYTIHITPERGSSYVSFETNMRAPSYRSLISNVLRTFRPGRFVLTLMADEGGLRQMQENPILQSPASSAKFVVPAVATATSATATAATTGINGGAGSGGGGGGRSTKRLVYKRSECASIHVEDDCCCMMGNWHMEMVTTTAAEEQKMGRETMDQVSNGSTTAVAAIGNHPRHPLRADKLRGMSVS